MSPRYRIDGQVIDAPVEAPGVPEGSGPSDWQIEVCRDSVPDADPDIEWTGEARDRDRTWCRFGRKQGLVRIDLAETCSIEAAAPWGKARLHIPPDGVSTLSALRHAVPYLAALKGQLVLHAASVVLGDSAIALCGEATTGKSTLALALDAAGVPVLGDDHVVLKQGNPYIKAHASFPFADVAQESRAAFRPDDATDPGKSRIRFLTPRPDKARLRALAFLRRGGTVQAERVAPAEVLIRLLRDVLFVGDPASRWEYEQRFVSATRLAESVAAFDVEIPTGLDVLAERLPEIRDQLEALLPAS